MYFIILWLELYTNSIFHSIFYKWYFLPVSAITALNKPYDPSQMTVKIPSQHQYSLLFKTQKTFSYLDHRAEMHSITSSTSSKSHTCLPCLIGIIYCLVVTSIVLTPSTIRIIKPFPCMTISLAKRNKL